MTQNICLATSRIYFFEKINGRLVADHLTANRGELYGKNIVVDTALSEGCDKNCYFLVEAATENEKYFLVTKGHQVYPQPILATKTLMRKLTQFRPKTKSCKWESFEVFAAKSINGNIPTLIIKYKVLGITDETQVYFDPYIIVDNKLQLVMLPMAFNADIYDGDMVDLSKKAYYDFVKIM